jgi:diadenylate cyclase
MDYVDNIKLIFVQLRWQDLLDLFMLWVVIYRILLLTKTSGAIQILTGIGFLGVLYSLSIWFELLAFNYVLELFFTNLFLIVVILFQGEIRRALAQIGSNPFFSEAKQLEETHIVEEIAKGAVALAQKGLGALIVIEREIALEYFVEEGVPLNADVEGDLMLAIFQPHSPLHDGALMIRGGRIHSAGCFLPLSKNPVLDKNLGTRHRAAIGLTEETDALVLVVSEENKSVGLVEGGTLHPDLDHSAIRQMLYDGLELKFQPGRGGN